MGIQLFTTVLLSAILIRVGWIIVSNPPPSNLDTASDESTLDELKEDDSCSDTGVESSVDGSPPPPLSGYSLRTTTSVVGVHQLIVDHRIRSHPPSSPPGRSEDSEPIGIGQDQASESKGSADRLQNVEAVAHDPLQDQPVSRSYENHFIETINAKDDFYDLFLQHKSTSDEPPDLESSSSSEHPCSQPSSPCESPLSILSSNNTNNVLHNQAKYIPQIRTELKKKLFYLRVRNGGVSMNDSHHSVTVITPVHKVHSKLPVPEPSAGSFHQPPGVGFTHDPNVNTYLDKLHRESSLSPLFDALGTADSDAGQAEDPCPSETITSSREKPQSGCLLLPVYDDPQACGDDIELGSHRILEFTSGQSPISPLLQNEAAATAMPEPSAAALNNKSKDTSLPLDSRTASLIQFVQSHLDVQNVEALSIYDEDVIYSTPFERNSRGTPESIDQEACAIKEKSPAVTVTSTEPRQSPLSEILKPISSDMAYPQAISPKHPLEPESLPVLIKPNRPPPSCRIPFKLLPSPAQVQSRKIVEGYLVDHESTHYTEEGVSYLLQQYPHQTAGTQAKITTLVERRRKQRGLALDPDSRSPEAIAAVFKLPLPDDKDAMLPDYFKYTKLGPIYYTTQENWHLRDEEGVYWESQPDQRETSQWDDETNQWDRSPSQWEAWPTSWEARRLCEGYSEGHMPIHAPYSLPPLNVAGKYLEKHAAATTVAIAPQPSPPDISKNTQALFYPAGKGITPQPSPPSQREAQRPRPRSWMERNSSVPICTPSLAPGVASVSLDERRPERTSHLTVTATSQPPFIIPKSFQRLSTVEYEGVVEKRNTTTRSIAAASQPPSTIPLSHEVRIPGRDWTYY